MGELSKEDANSIGLQFVKTYVNENNLNVPTQQIEIFQTDRVGNKWVVYLTYLRKYTDEELINIQPWVAIYDNKKVKGYNFLLWGGENKPD